MKRALLTHNPHWEARFPDLYPRALLPVLAKKLALKQIQVLQGSRRSGKSSLFRLLIQHLVGQGIEAKSILYVNLDDPYFGELYTDSKQLYSLLDLSESVTGHKVAYLFLDEVQNVARWEKFVKAIYDNQQVQKIFVTGSNSSLLEGEFATLLSGRYVRDIVYPPSLAELLQAQGYTDYLSRLANKPKILALMMQMMEYGAFYEVIEQQDEGLKRDILLNYYDTVIFKDCIANNQIRETKSFREVAHFLISNTANLYSYNSLARALGQHDSTIKEYIRVLEDCYVLTELKPYSYSLKAQLKAKKKSYIIDNGFLAQTAFRFSANYGTLFENLVFSELVKQGYELFFISSDFECDFIARKEGQLTAIQVCYQLTPQNRERERQGLLKLKLEVARKLLITFDQSEPVADGIETLPFWEVFG
jgi:predicted AAA+ superfamily ATPase